MLEEQQLYELIDNLKTATRNNLVGDCPFCGKEGHFYINKGQNGRGRVQPWDCKKCGENGTIYSLLYKLDKRHLLSGAKVDVFDDLKKKITDGENDTEELSIEVPTIPKPIGYRRFTSDSYLNNRGFEEDDYYRYDVGQTKLVNKLDNRIVFLVKDENFVKGYVARTILKKEQLKEIEEQTGKKIPKYSNAKGVDFSKLLYGYDEINFLTKTVILVEGIFNKVRIDKALKLYSEDDIKCCATFGKKVSAYQAMKLLLKGVEKLILLFDADAINDSKKVLNTISRQFPQIEVGFLSEEQDVDNMSENQILELFSNLEDYRIFLKSKVQKIEL